MRSFRLSLVFPSVFLLALAGCKPEEEIAKETVTLADREKIRLRVAVVERPRHVYFFRLSGPVDEINAQDATFSDFVRTANFVGNKKPTFTDPKGWKKDPPAGDKGMMGIETLARFRLDAKPKEIEIAVTRFPAKGFDLMTNVHRWQKQVNVGLTESHKELEEQVKREKNKDWEIKWVDLTGLAVHTVSKPADPVAANPKKNVLPIPAAAIPFEYAMPKGWVRKPPRKIAQEVIEILNADDDDVAEVTFVVFGAGGGGIGPNINRWRKEIKLPEVPDAEAENAAVKLDVLNVKAPYVDLDNPKGPEEHNRTLAVIIPLGERTWFVKMSGPRDWVGENKAAFEGFVKSLKRK